MIFPYACRCHVFHGCVCDLDECSKLSYDAECIEDESILFADIFFDSSQIENMIISDS